MEENLPQQHRDGVPGPQILAEDLPQLHRGKRACQLAVEEWDHLHQVAPDWANALFYIMLMSSKEYLKNSMMFFMHLYMCCYDEEDLVFGSLSSIWCVSSVPNRSIFSFLILMFLYCRAQAIAIGQALVDGRWLDCVTHHDQVFRDEYALYRPLQVTAPFWWVNNACAGKESKSLRMHFKLLYIVCTPQADIDWVSRFLW